MRIGSGWTRTQKETNKQFISVALDEAFLKLVPQLQGCNLVLSYIDPQERKSDKAPGWSVNLSERKPQTQEAAETATEEIPY